MKKQVFAFCTAGLLAITLVSPALAASLNNVRPDILLTAEAAVPLPTAYPEDAEGTLSFQNLEARMRSSNLSILALQRSLETQKKFDRKATYDDLVDTINTLVEAAWGLDQMGATAQAAQLNATAESLRGQLDPLKEEEYQDTIDRLAHQIESAIWQIITGAQSLYLNILSYEASLIDLNRSLTTLNNSIYEMELRHELGQVSTLTLAQLKNTRQSTQSQKVSMELGLEKMRASLDLLLGESNAEELKLLRLPPLSTQEPLDDQSYEAALAQAKELSYTGYSAELSRKDAEDAWKDAQKSMVASSFSYSQAEQTYLSAMGSYETAIKNFELNFKGLYQAVHDTQQALDAVTITLRNQEQNYEASRLKHTLGQISDMQLLTAEEEVKTAKAAVAAAELKAFTAYHQYRTIFIPDAA